MKISHVDSDNALADWMADARKGEAACYFQHNIKSGEFLCAARLQKPLLPSPRNNTGKAKEYNDDANAKIAERNRSATRINAAADKAWSLQALGFVNLAQMRRDGTCLYLAIKR